MKFVLAELFGWKKNSVIAKPKEVGNDSGLLHGDVPAI